MDIFTAIETRRSNGIVTDQPVSKEQIEALLEMAAWAPNHKRTEPWAFHVFSGDARQKLADALAVENGEETGQKAFRAPTVIAVVATPGRGEKNPPVWEDHAATAAALQNMALAAHGLGLAGFWKSGKFCEQKPVKDLLKVDESKEDRIMGFFYVGHPDTDRPQPLRAKPHWQEKTTWY
tara:strand:+ start:25509 stop:26045 length:537 start_codon:yes stop_codon:yes gene_type:complete